MALTLASCGGATYEETRSQQSSATKNETAATNHETAAQKTEQPAAPKVETPAALAANNWKSGRVVSQAEIDVTGLDNCFVAEEISDEVFARMKGKSWPDNCTLKRSDLRHIRVLHCNADGNYDANDDASMADNNTSAFNFRFVPGTRNLSRHSYGLAIDVNPLYNPYIPYHNGKQVVMPPNGEPYAFHRDTAQFPYKIDLNDLAYKLFRKEGFNWGGSWPKSKDYQHFQWVE